MHDTVVIGGGLVGMSIAYHLVRQGAKTLLVDRQDPGRATDAGIGVLAPEIVSAHSRSRFRFGFKAVNYYRTLVRQLKVEQAGEVGHALCSRLSVAVSEKDLESFERIKDIILTRQEYLGQNSRDDLKVLSPDQARDLFPPLGPVRGAIYYRYSACVDGYMLLRSLRRLAEKEGLEVKKAGVDQLIMEDQAVAGVVVDGEIFNAGKIAIAGGAWSAAFGDQLGVSIPVEPQRGQIIYLKLAGVDTTGWPIITTTPGYYLLPRPDNQVIAGATMENGSGFNASPTAAGVHELLNEALRIAPGLGSAEIKGTRVGLRPTTTDELPILGSVPGIANIYLATGHGTTGLQLGPYSGKIIADLMLGQNAEFDISDFDVARFL